MSRKSEIRWAITPKGVLVPCGGTIKFWLLVDVDEWDHCEMTIEQAEENAKKFALFVWIRPIPPVSDIVSGLQEWEGAVGTEKEIEKLWPGFLWKAQPKIFLTLDASTHAG